MLESDEIPDQQALIQFIRKGMMSLGAESIEKVKIYGKQVGEDFPAWIYEFELLVQTTAIKFPASTSSTISNQKNQSKAEFGVRTQNRESAFPSSNKDLCYEVVGVNGQIRLTRNRLIISRKGVLGFMTQGLKGEKEIPISRITAIQFKRPDEFTNGYLQLSIQGSMESKGGIFAATQDENTVMFSKTQQSEFEEVKRYIDSVIDGESIDFSTLGLAKTETNSDQIMVEKTEYESTSIKSINKKKPWYEEDLAIIILLLLFWPVGLYLMWKYSKWSSKVKWSVTAVFAIFIFIKIFSK